MVQVNMHKGRGLVLDKWGLKCDKPVHLYIVPYKTGCVDTLSSCINAWNAGWRCGCPFPSQREERREASVRSWYQRWRKSIESVDRCLPNQVSVNTIDIRTIATRPIASRSNRSEWKIHSHIHSFVPPIPKLSIISRWSVVKHRLF